MIKSKWGILPLLGALVAVLALSAGGCALLTSGTSSPAVTPAASAPQGDKADPGTALVLPSVSDVVAKVRPSVVSVVTQELSQGFFSQPFYQEGAGSGVIIDPKGYILTNNHVIENARSIRVTLVDGRVFDAVQVVGKDPATDLAVIKIEGANLPAAPLGDSDKLKVGDWVIALGNALALGEGPTVTVGIISATGRSISTERNTVLQDMIQTDAAINPGNSGGPLVNLDGEVAGINTAIDTRGQGIGFAISISSARPIVEQLLTKGKVVWPWIGVSATTITPGIAADEKLSVNKGVLVVGVQRGTPAERADLKPRDIITSIDGKKVETVRQLQDAIRQKKIGEKVEIAFLRNGGEQKKTVDLEEMPRS